MHRQSGRHLKTDYYLEIECLPDEELFSPSQIAKRKYDKHTQPKCFARMFHSIYQFGIRNGLALEPDNGKRLPGGKLAMTDKGRAELKPGERRAKWLGKTWKSKLYIEDREEIRQYAKELLINTLSQCLVKKHREEDAMRRKDAQLKKTARKIRLKKGLMVAALVAAIVLTAGSLYNYSFLHEGFGILRNQGPKAAFEFFQNSGDSYDNMFGQAWAAFRNGDYDLAEKLNHSVLESHADTDRARAFYLFGNIKIKQGDFDQAQEDLLTAESIYESLGNERSLYRTRMVQAKLYLDRKDLDNARYYANLVGQNSEAQQDEYYFYIQSQIALLFNDFEDALRFALQREKMFAGDRSQLVSIYSDIGFFYGLLGDLDNCLQYTVKAESTANIQKNPKGLMFNNINMCLYLKCSLKDYSDLRDSILAYARENKEEKLMEWMYFVDKFNCPIEPVGDGDPPPPDDSPPSAEQTASNRNDSGQKPASSDQENLPPN